MVNQRHIR